MIRKRLFTVLFATALAALTLMAGPREKNNILSLKNSITDDDIVFPESFDTDVHKMMTNWYLQNYAVLDADVENKSPGEVGEETYIKRLAAIPSEIEMPYNQIVRQHIERYVYRSRTLVEQMLGMSLYYMPIFEQALEKEGLPLELKYLPIVESALDPNATSRVGAAGLWQFMIGTGKGLGLEVNSLVDERRDPYRSSAMAAKYLKNLYQIYNDWSLAIAAYNCGPGNVNKALHSNGGTGDFWDIYQYLPRETRGYVPAFIAANYAMTYYKQHNISPSLARKPLITDTVTVNRRIHFGQIAQVLNIPIEEIRTLNPQYRKDVIPGDSHPYVLVLPSQQIYSFIMSEDTIDNYRADVYEHRPIVEPGGDAPTPEEYLSGRTSTGDMRTTTHKVGRNETAASIAAKYNMTTSELMALNGKKSERVRRGEVLKVKASGPSIASADNDEMLALNSNDSSQPTEVAQETNEQEQFDEVKKIEEEAATKAPYQGSYTVNLDDEIKTTKTTKSSSYRTDEQTARQHASRSNSGDWRARNKKYSSTESYKSGKNSKKSKTEYSSKSSKSHKSGKDSKHHQKQQKPSEVTVKKGESLTQIAEKNGVSVKDLERANGIQNGNKIKAGEKIKIPTKAEARQAAAAEKSKSKGGKSGKADKGGSTSKSSKADKGGSTSKSSKADKGGKSSKADKGSSTSKSGKSSKADKSGSSSKSSSGKSSSSGSSGKSSKKSKKK